MLSRRLTYQIIQQLDTKHYKKISILITKTIIKNDMTIVFFTMIYGSNAWVVKVTMM